MSVTIYGASDDLIEIDGDLSEEFGSYDAGTQYVAVSTGLLATIAYGQGDEAFWRIHVLVPGTAPYKLTQATDESSDYSDKLTIEGEVAWVVVGGHHVRKAARR